MVTGFVLARVRAHRLLLAAALIAVVLTTTVLSTLAAFSGTIGDAALRHTLQTRDTAATALVVKAPIAPDARTAADDAVRKGARETFDGLPTTVATLVRSGPYALPRSLQAPAERAGNPDLTQLAALDPARVTFTEGRAPRAVDGRTVEVALPEAAARELKVRPGRELTLTDRLSGPKVRVEVTGVYRPKSADDPYWHLDDLRGRGVQKVAFTTYGPLFADPSVLKGERVSEGQTAWLASPDFAAMSTGRIDGLREAAREGVRELRKDPALGGSTAVTTALPTVLDRVERSLLVSRSTLLIVALQLVLLAGYALLLVARLLSAERAGETGLLRARGGSRARIAGLAAAEALLLAVPAALCAPLLAGPLTRLLAGQGALSRIGLRLDTGPDALVWLVAAGVALGCALAVTLPALTSADGPERGRARALPAPLRAGADVGLLVIAGVAYWQLDRQTSGSGALAGDRGGGLGIDPLLVMAPALALLAGTVLTLRLMPPVAKLAERRAAGGRGLAAALAGWQFSRRPLRGAGPVLLLVLAVAMGMLAIGQGASWNRSQDDQADFRAGAEVRVASAGSGELGQAGVYAATPGVREAAPGSRTSILLSGDRQATVLALDTEHAADAMLLRSDLADRPADKLVGDLGTARESDRTAGTPVPKGTKRLDLTLRLDSAERSTGKRPPFTAPVEAPDVTVTVEDRYGTPYRFPVGEVPTDGKAHRLTLDLVRAAGGSAGRIAEPLALTGLELTLVQPVGISEDHTLTLEGLRATDASGTGRAVPLSTAWRASHQIGGSDVSSRADARPTAPKVGRSTATALSVSYGTGFMPGEYGMYTAPTTLTVQVAVDRARPAEVTAVATDTFLSVTGSRIGQSVDVSFGGTNVPVKLVDRVRALPTTAVEDLMQAPAATDGADGSDGSDGSAPAAGPAAMDGGALLVDLRAVNLALTARHSLGITPTEWWLTPESGRTAEVAAAVRARPDIDPSSVLVRDEIANGLRDDPLGAGPESALAAAAVAAAALAAVGFAVSTAGSLRERAAEFTVLRALGTPRRRLARLVAAEQGILITLALLVGVALGAVLTRAVVPLVVLTARATQPIPTVSVALPPERVALLLALVAFAPLLVTAALPLRRTADMAASLRQGGE
ncbi:FtsX-like permease family protein [Streptomyces sp. NPDC091292]|uniref:FtsX-like permease family protein n=1 Tax=Streptomyces sp. NPDC091292 TaxID=3365991 RepID=UPI00380874D5